MAGNSFGQAFRITTAGESHGPAHVVIIDGVPPGIELSVDELMVDLNRRRPGQSKIVTQRDEADTPEILSGLFEGRTTGTSLAILVRNQDQRSRDYADIQHVYRPGHADYTYDAKYGFRDYRGGGRSSARETTVRVAAGVVAKKLIADAFGGRVVGYVKQVGDIIADVPDPEAVTLEQVEKLPGGEPNIVRCPDPAAAAKMVALIERIRGEGDSIGGAAEIVATSIPPGLGEPVFDKIKADLAKALFSLPAVLGVEYGIGFGCVTLRGSQNNDLFRAAKEKNAAGRPVVTTDTNRHGGMLGGITSGRPLVLRAAVKPTSSLPIEQETVNDQGQPTTIRTKGRHDPCLLPRFVPMAEAMVAIVLADHWLRWKCSANDGVAVTFESEELVSWHQRELTLERRRRGFHLITDEVVAAMPELATTRIGLLHVFIQHTSASLTINENADSDVLRDMEASLNAIAPEDFPYRHTVEGPDDMPAHVKSSLIGCSLSVPVRDGRLVLGTWQGIYLCEHRDSASRRRLTLTLQGEDKSAK